MAPIAGGRRRQPRADRRGRAGAGLTRGDRADAHRDRGAPVRASPGARQGGGGAGRAEQRAARPAEARHRRPDRGGGDGAARAGVPQHPRQAAVQLPAGRGRRRVRDAHDQPAARRRPAGADRCGPAGRAAAGLGVRRDRAGRAGGRGEVRRRPHRAGRAADRRRRRPIGCAQARVRSRRRRAPLLGFHQLASGGRDEPGHAAGRHLAHVPRRRQAVRDVPGGRQPDLLGAAEARATGGTRLPRVACTSC